MKTDNNLTLRDHIILRLLDKSLEYSDVYDLSDLRIAQIHHVANKLATHYPDNNIPGSDVSLDIDISVTDIPKMAINALERTHSITTIGQLVTLTRKEVRRTRGIGNKSLIKIDEFMESHNLKFADQ